MQKKEAKAFIKINNSTVLYHRYAADRNLLPCLNDRDGVWMTAEELSSLLR